MQDRSRWDALEKRLVQLETRVGESAHSEHRHRHEDVNRDLARIRQMLQEYTPLEDLVVRLKQCNVEYSMRETIPEALSSEMGLEQVREVVLASYGMLEASVEQLETVMEQQEAFFTRFKDVYAELARADIYDRQSVLESFRRIQERFSRIVKRLVLLLEERAILRYKQEELMVSIEGLCAIK